jgi:hypothetical protein
LVVALKGPPSQPVEVVLHGRVDSVKGRLRNTFEAVPDAPVTRFTLKMRGGKKSLLVNSRNICRSVNRVAVRMIAQNGASYNFRQKIEDSCKTSKKRRSANGHRRR